MNKLIIFILAVFLSFPFVAMSQEVETLPFEAVEETVPEPQEALEEATVETEIITPTEEVSEAKQQEPEARAVPHSGLYFDADTIGPNALSKPTVPREVDPKYEPGSRFVVVQKSAGSGSMQAQIVAGKRAISLGRHSSALEIFENLYRKSPENREVLLGLAIAQQNSGFTESAISTYEELLEIDPNHIEANVNMLGLMKARYPAIAFRRLKDLWEKNSQNADIAAQLGLAGAAAGNTPDALRYLGIAASLDPQNASHYYNMAVLSDRAGASREAVSFYEKALEVDATYSGARSIPRDNIYDRLAYLRRL